MGAIPVGGRFAVVDIGSNTAKLSIYACEPGGPAPLAHDADTVRIGYRVSDGGRFDPDRVERLLAALRRFERLGRAHGATEFRGVATQAFRVAADGRALIDRIGRETAWRVEIIDAAEETRLTVVGAAPWLAPGEPNLVADIGGASTEVVAIDATGAILAASSVPIGSGLLYDEEIGASPPPDGALERVTNRATRELDAADVIHGTGGALLLPGWTGHFLQLLLRSLEPEATLGPKTLTVVHAWLARRHAIETMERIPIQLDRAQVLPASLAIVEALVLRYVPQRIVPIPSGIRDGIAQSLCRSD